MIPPVFFLFAALHPRLIIHLIVRNHISAINKPGPVHAADAKEGNNRAYFDDCCKRLVKGTRVFLDTTEFVSANFDIHNPAFQEFCRLCEIGELRLLSTEITRREIKAHIDGFATYAHRLLQEVSKVIHTLPKAEAEAVKTIAHKLKASVLSDGLLKDSEEFFKKCNAVNLVIPPKATQHVLNLYFDRKPPFGGGNKKDEFPDAFVLQALQESARRHAGSLFAVSDDGDFKAACHGQPDLVYVKSLAFLLNCFHARDASVKRVRATIEENFKLIEEELKRILESLPAELEGRGGTAQLNTIRLDDILDILVVAYGKTTASAQFVCSVEVDALLEFIDSANAYPDFRSVHRMEVVSITLDFQFDPKDVQVFSVKTYWAPMALTFGPSG